MSQRVIEAGRIAEESARLGQAIQAADFSQELAGPVRGLVLQGIRDNFTGSRDPSGKPWAPRKNIGDGHPLLMDTGRLMQAATGGGAGHSSAASSRELSVGVSDASVPYAKYHETGTSKMPARRFMGVQERRLAEIDEIIADAGLEALDR